MSTSTTRRRRTPPQPVHGTCRWIKPLVLPGGIGTLVINDQEYDCEGIYDDGRLVGFRLVKVDETVYDIDATGDPWQCDCPDATFQPERPEGCKHVKALRAALKSIAQQP